MTYKVIQNVFCYKTDRTYLLRFSEKGGKGKSGAVPLFPLPPLKFIDCLEPYVRK